MLIAIIVIVGLSLLILGHEAGHFFAAKLFGLKVDEFGFGFPPRIGAWTPHKTIWGKDGETLQQVQGETEYSFNWLPFGGFVKISGERGEFAMLEEEGSKVESQKSESAEAQSAIRNPQSENSNSNRLFFAQPTWKKSLILLAGVIMNFIFGWLFISIAFMIGTPQALVVGGVEAGSPAAAVGIAMGDVIKNFKDSQSFIAFVDANKGKPTQFDILRNGKEMDFTATPRVQVGPNEGALGVALADAGYPREAFFSALWDGLKNTVELLGLTVSAFYQLIKSLVIHGSLLAGVVGPVGIFGVAEQTGSIGLVYLLQFLGIISINLTVVNLIPFPALDGGRFLMTIIEKIKGSPIPEKFEGWVNGLGFAALILLMVLLTVRDVRGLF
jgi:regulator of sigma E protease